MRYFFHLDGDPHKDEIGLDLPDLAAVRRQAIMSARDILDDDDSSQWDGRRFEMRVVDEAGVEIIRVRFEMVERTPAPL